MRVQVLIVFLMMGLVPLYLFSIIITNAYESRLVSQRVDELQSYGTMISNLVVSSGYLVDHDSEEVREEVAQIAIRDALFWSIRIFGSFTTHMVLRTAKPLFRPRLSNASAAPTAST